MNTDEVKRARFPRTGGESRPFGAYVERGKLDVFPEQRAISSTSHSTFEHVCRVVPAEASPVRAFSLLGTGGPYQTC
jgi:hypothetical protein